MVSPDTVKLVIKKMAFKGGHIDFMFLGPLPGCCGSATDTNHNANTNEQVISRQANVDKKFVPCSREPLIIALVLEWKCKIATAVSSEKQTLVTCFSEL